MERKYEVTACATCKRAVYTDDVDEFGNCIGCKAAPASPTFKPTEAEWADLGRPDDVDHDSKVKGK